MKEITSKVRADATWKVSADPANVIARLTINGCTEFVVNVYKDAGTWLCMWDTSVLAPLAHAHGQVSLIDEALDLIEAEIKELRNA